MGGERRRTNSSSSGLPRAHFSLCASAPRPLPFSAAPPPPELESELQTVKMKISKTEQEIAETKEEVEAAAEDVCAKELLASPARPGGRPSRDANLKESLKFDRAKELSLRAELAALQGQALELQKKENLLLASSSASLGPSPTGEAPLFFRGVRGIKKEARFRSLQETHYPY